MGWDANEGDIAHGYYNGLRSLMAGTFTKSPDPNKWRPACTLDSVSRWRAAAAKYPEFPWSSFALAICGYNAHDSSTTA